MSELPAEVLRCQVDSLRAALEAQPAESVRVYYMRDNRTFLRLSLDVDDALRQVKSEWDDGYTHGMLCAKAKGITGQVHAGADWFAFEHAARKWYEQITARLTGPKRPLQEHADGTD